MQKLQRYVDRWWYAPLVATLAFLDTFIVVVPNDGILVSSSMILPRRWILFAVSITIGSTLGGLALTALLEMKGVPWVLELYPGIAQTSTWIWTTDFFSKYGLYVIFAIALTPSFQQPGIIIASMAGTPILEMGIVMFIGRLIKFLFMSYIGSHAPAFLEKLWGVRAELKDVGIKIEKEK